MKIQLLHTTGCQGYHQAIDALEEALLELGLEPQFEIIQVATQEDAEGLHFFASPTILIDGQDIEEKARAIQKFGLGTCRPYFWEGKAYDYTPREMIVEAIKKTT